MARDEINQTKCLINTNGHVWMKDFFDTLPRAARQRLRSSPFNLCPACLVLEVLSKVKAKQRGLSHERALLAAIEIMESQVRKEGVGKR
jgi:hypothetical protein